MFNSFMSRVKDLVISILVLKAYFFFLILFPFSLVLAKFIKKNNQKNLFVIFATNLSNEKKIKYVGGSNLSLTNPIGFKFLNRNHYWSRYAQIWGWATWKDRWIHNNERSKNLISSLSKSVK